MAGWLQRRTELRITRKYGCNVSLVLWKSFDLNLTSSWKNPLPSGWCKTGWSRKVGEKTEPSASGAFWRRTRVVWREHVPEIFAANRFCNGRMGRPYEGIHGWIVRGSRSLWRWVKGFVVDHIQRYPLIHYLQAQYHSTKRDTNDSFGTNLRCSSLKKAAWKNCPKLVLTRKEPQQRVLLLLGWSSTSQWFICNLFWCH